MSNPNKKRCLEDDVDASSNDVAHFSLPSDKNPTPWWVVDVESSDSNQGASGLVKRCMREYDWSLDKATNILEAYLQFLILKKQHKDWDAEVFSPSHLVDQMWHQHVLDTSNYHHDMMIMCGRIVPRNPDGALDLEAKKARDERTRTELIYKFGPDNVDREIWGFPSPLVPEMLDTEDGDADHATITISIKGWDSNVAQRFFKLRMHTKLGKPFLIFEIYARRENSNFSTLRFLFNGDRVRDAATPAMLGMEDGDCIDCVPVQKG